jgi:hypothetical protein
MGTNSSKVISVNGRKIRFLWELFLVHGSAPNLHDFFFARIADHRVNTLNDCECFRVSLRITTRYQDPSSGVGFSDLSRKLANLLISPVGYRTGIDDNQVSLFKSDSLLMSVLKQSCPNGCTVRLVGPAPEGCNIEFHQSISLSQKYSSI